MVLRFRFAICIGLSRGFCSFIGFGWSFEWSRFLVCCRAQCLVKCFGVVCLVNGRTRNHPSNGREDWAGKQEAARRELVQKVRGNQLQVGRVKGEKKKVREFGASLALRWLVFESSHRLAYLVTEFVYFRWSVCARRQGGWCDCISVKLIGGVDTDHVGLRTRKRCVAHWTGSKRIPIIRTGTAK